LYRARGAELRKRRGALPSSHPQSVATTFALSFEKVERANPAAAELLRFCAFLHPDAIPEEIITDGAAELGPVLGFAAQDPLRLNTAFGEILKFSLLRRDASARTLSMHRLVQAVLKDGTDVARRREWTERTVRAVNRAFPFIEFASWLQCERLLPSALAGATLIEHWGFEFVEAARLLNQAGLYLYERGRFAEAEPLFRRALAIKEKALGPEHPDVARVLENHAALLRETRREAEAEKLEARARTIRAKHGRERLKSSDE
jgi:tetratricopeptide (TPR) repeat protein